VGDLSPAIRIGKLAVARKDIYLLDADVEPKHARIDEDLVWHERFSQTE
jgi:hypothetical protein